MTRHIEVYDDSTLVDNSTLADGSSIGSSSHKEITTDNLPLQIFSVKDKESGKENYIIVSTIGSNENNKHKNILGYISQEDEHIFFQPNDDNLTNIIYHNDEIIKKSVWLKSGDHIQFQNKVISYFVSGDKIKILVSEAVEKPMFVQPTKKENTSKLVQNNRLHHPAPRSDQHKNKQKKNKIIKSIFAITFFILALLAAFILLAETISINIEPEPDNLSLRGTFPNIKLDKRYLVMSGEYQLRAEKSEYRILEKQIKVSENNTEFSYTMKENPGWVQFNIEPEKNNEIYIDGKILNVAISDPSILKSNETIYEMDKGEYTLRVINPRYKEYKQNITITGKNKKQTYNISLQANWGIVELATTQNVDIKIYASTNKEEIIYENNSLIGNKEIELISGDYVLYATKEKYKEQITTFSIKAEQALKLDIPELEFKDGILKISSSPSGSLIRIDGKYFGQTPQTIKVIPYQEHDLELSLAGYRTMTNKIDLLAEQVLEKDIQLIAKSSLVFISVSPKHAQLFINGKQQKNNSGQFKLIGNKNIVMVKAKAYQTQTKNISTSHFSQNISFILKKNAHTKNPITSSNKNTKSKIIANNTNYKNSIGQNMIKVQAAVFMMGSKKNETGRSSNEAEHKIQINYAFLMSDKEVSNKQYRKYNNSHNSGSSGAQSLNLDKQPVVNISWNNAAKFANWLSLKESLPAYYKQENGSMIPVNISAKIPGYRLPFEAEWVLAARGKKQKKYPWSGQYPPTSSSGNYADESAKNHIANTINAYNDQYSASAPIGNYVKNAQGFYDLGGNVSEWCHDYYSPSAGLSRGSVAINPTGPKKGTHHVVRDASWRDASIREVRLSYRSYSKKKSNDIGFRLVRYAQ